MAKKKKIDIPTVGNFPHDIPRDIVEIDTLYEHILLGQVLEPLVSADREGQIQAGLAKSWFFSKDGLKLTLAIDTDRKFSNGKNVTTADVVYSLNIHLNSKNSQTNKFLSDIVSIKATQEDTVEVELSSPRVAIIKVLSREQLGIVPDQWKFDSESSEPYVGSGAYRLLKKAGEWYLQANQHFHHFSKISVSEWRLLHFGDKTTPDHMPFATTSQLEKEGLNAFHPLVEQQLSFVQSSYWWYPGGRKYNNASAQNRAIQFMHELVESNVSRSQKPLATGVIPVGIAGHLKVRPTFAAKSIESELPRLKLSIAVPANLIEEHFGTKDRPKEAFAKLTQKHGLDVDIHTIDFLNWNKEVKALKPDLILVRWAGGFNDPEGFLAILDRELGVSLAKYHALAGSLYNEARGEQDWKKRNELFRKLGRALVTDGKMVPAWKTPVYRYTAPPLEMQQSYFRYTPRLLDIKIRESSK